MVEKAENSPLVCHCLIGPPGAGKSTLAQRWTAQFPQYQWISTDRIREQLYGSASTQGSWLEIEAVVLGQIREAIAHHQSVIYDATNARRRWRVDLMQTLADEKTPAGEPVLWMAWWLKTSLALCKQHNQKRSRRVEDSVIEQMHQALKVMPPIPAEGFAAVNKISAEQDISEIARKIQRLPHTLQQRSRRQGQCQLHAYSSLLAFERLLYLMATLLAFPGVAHSQISVLIAQQYGERYADPVYIEENLAWLQANHIINAPYSAQPIQLVEEDTLPAFPLHRYSDRDVFKRLISTVRFIAHHPFLYQAKRGSLKTLVATMESQNVIPPGYIDSVRRDIGEVLKPYQLIPTTPQTKGYFMGTAVLATSQLLQVFDCLTGQVRHLNDPVLLDTYEVLRDRLLFLYPNLSTATPARSVLQQPIVDTQQLPAHTISLAAPGNAERLEAAIRAGQRLKVKRRRGTGRYGGEQEMAFSVLPLQVVFHNIAWYLGYQRVADGLLRFERLDRLELFEVEPDGFSEAAQAKAWQNLMVLYQASYGLHVGNRVEDQQAFLRGVGKPAGKRAASPGIEVVCELWFSDEMFRFVSEGAQRFAGRQKMSPRLTGSVTTTAEKKTIFCLKKTGDARFPNRLQVRLPCWVVAEDVDFKRWILGFGGHVKVVAPLALAQDVRQQGQNILAAYEEASL